MDAAAADNSFGTGVLLCRKEVILADPFFLGWWVKPLKGWYREPLYSDSEVRVIQFVNRDRLYIMGYSAKGLTPILEWSTTIVRNKWWPPKRKEIFVGEFIRKAKARVQARAESSSVHDPEWQSKWPALFDYMCSNAWDAKTARKTTTLWLFTEFGLVKACVNDRDTNETAFMTHTTLFGLFQSIEDGLADDTLSWRYKEENGVLRRVPKRGRQERD